MRYNRTATRFDVVQLPKVLESEDFGVKECCEPYLVLAGGSEDWQNENTMKEYDLDRETRRGDYHYGASGKNTPEGSKLRKLAADGKGGFSVEYGDVIKDVQNQTAGDSTPKPNPSGHSEGKQWSSTGKSKGRKGTYTDTRAAVTGGHITEEDAIEISPTYAKKYASRAAAKKAKGVGKS